MPITRFEDAVFIGWGILVPNDGATPNHYRVRLSHAGCNHWNILDSEVPTGALSGSPICVKVNPTDQYATPYNVNHADNTMQGSVDKLRLARTYANGADDDGWRAGEWIDQVIEQLLAQNPQVV